MSIREQFVALFGEDNAKAIEAAAKSHAESENKGSDPFRWALSICIGYECMSKFADYHGITAPWQDIDKWMAENAILREHDGDCDCLALFAGNYDRYVGV